MPDYRRTARQAARRYGLDPVLFERQINAESGFRTGRTSNKGATGIAQFEPGTARGLGVDPNNPVQALNGAARLMAGYVKKYGSYENALRAYNAGPGAIEASKGYAETNAYVAKILRGGRGASGASGGTTGAGTTGGGTTTTTTTTGLTPDQMLANAIGDRPGWTLEAPPLPQNLTPQGYTPVITQPPTSPPQSALQTAIQQATTTTTSGSQPGSQLPTPNIAGPVHSPLARTGQVIGTPYAGTHTLGDWQSDNAVDIKVPEGTSMVALQDGVVVKVRHHPQDGGRFAGDQITIRARNGNEYFYAHGIASVRPGQRIKRGQKLGVTGSANGTPHLHFGQKRGDPRAHT